MCKNIEFDGVFFISELLGFSWKALAVTSMLFVAPELILDRFLVPLKLFGALWSLAYVHPCPSFPICDVLSVSLLSRFGVFALQKEYDFECVFSVVLVCGKGAQRGAQRGRAKGRAKKDTPRGSQREGEGMPKV